MPTISVFLPLGSTSPLNSKINPSVASLTFPRIRSGRAHFMLPNTKLDPPSTSAFITCVSERPSARGQKRHPQSSCRLCFSHSPHAVPISKSCRQFLQSTFQNLTAAAPLVQAPHDPCLDHLNRLPALSASLQPGSRTDARVSALKFKSLHIPPSA